MSDNTKSRFDFSMLTARNIIVMSCFFFSGFAGLLYEICWIRKASLVFGCTTFALSAVIAVFFAGLALGSYLFGRYSQKISEPLKLYALLEIVLGVLAIPNPFLFELADSIYGLFYSEIFHNFFLLSVIRFFLIFLLILPPTILMGASLPLFCRQYINSEKKILMSVGFLYGVNTLGSAIGCAIGGFLLVPLIGVNKTIWLAGAINILIGLIVLQTKIKAKTFTDEKAEVKLVDASSSVPPYQIRQYLSHDIIAISVLFFFSGFIALANEILFARYLTLIIHSTTYTYIISLTVTLVGMVIGSFLISILANKIYRLPFIFGAVNILSGIIVLLILLLPSASWDSFIDAADFSAVIFVIMVILLIPTILSGVSFPLATRMVIERPSLAGMAVGKMTAINTLGGIAGSLLFGFFMLTFVGLQKSLLLTTGISLLIGFVSWFSLEKTMKLLTKSSIIVVCTLIWIVTPFVAGTKLPDDFLARSHEKLIDYVEGLNSNLCILESDGIKQLLIDRLFQGADNIIVNQTMAAHIPMILHQNPRSALVIGIGAGQTASSFLYYDLRRLDCIDIERELPGLIQKHFRSEWENDDRYQVIIEDGRNYIVHSKMKYDIISIEIGQTFRPGIASFYTADFYQHARERLADNGLISQFIPIFYLGPDEFLSVIRSFIEVFPESVLWYNSSELLLIGSKDSKISISTKRLQLLNSNKKIREELQSPYWGGPEHWRNRPEIFMAGFICGPKRLFSFTEKADIYDDDLPMLEYSSARKKDEFSNIKNIVEIMMANTDPIHLIHGERLTDEISSKIKFVQRLNLGDIMASHLLQSYKNNPKIQLLEIAIKWNPYNLNLNFLLAKEYSKKRMTERAVFYYGSALRIDPDHFVANFNLGSILARKKDYNEAMKHFSKCLEIKPDDVNVIYNLGLTLMEKGEIDEANKYLKKAMKINPDLFKERGRPQPP